MKSKTYVGVHRLKPLSSMLFSLTALSLLGFYMGFTAYLGEGEDVVAVCDRGSRTPFTGLVPAYLAGKMCALSGVLACSPEVVAPFIVKGEAFFLRGIMPEEFMKLNQLAMVGGRMLDVGDLNCMVVGVNAAGRLRVNIGDGMLVLSVLADRYVELHVKGIFVSHSPLDDEILTPLHVGQWMRGVDYGYVTLIRLRIDRSVVTLSRILEEIDKEASEISQLSNAPSSRLQNVAPGIMVRFRVEDVGVVEAYDFMRSCMDRFGLMRESILILSVMVFLLSGASIVAASKTILVQHVGEINVLRFMGASKRLLKMDMLVKILPLSAAASSLGFAAAVAVLMVIRGSGCMQVLSHTAPLSITQPIIILNFIIVILLFSVSIFRGSFE